MCKEHKNEHIKFLCKDCKKAVCHTCCTIYHRKCDQVVTIESEKQTMKSVIAKARGELSLKQDEAKKHVEKQQSKVNEETDRHKQMESDVQSESKKLIDKIKLQERKLLAELKEMSDKHIGQLKANIKLGEMSVQMYQQQTELMDQALQSKCDMDVYEMYQGCEAGDVEAVGDADLKEKRIEMISFRQNSSVLSRAIDNLQLGEIDVLYEDVLDLEATPALRDTITTRVAGDVKTKDSYDVKVMVVNGTDTVVITDRENKCVKSFYTRNNQPCHSRLKLNNIPWGLTRSTHNQVAVTMPHINRIITVGVNPDLELLSTITTSKTYVGITSLTSSTLAASSQSPPCVDILDMTGNALRSIGPLHNGKNILQHPNYFCTTRTGNILVSDCATKCVVCLTPEGDVVFTYRPTGDTALQSPRGITSTSTGDILVSDNHLHRVIHLTESGRFVGNILTGLKQPQGICQDGRGKVYVLSRGIKVFTFVTQ